MTGASHADPRAVRKSVHRGRHDVVQRAERHFELRLPSLERVEHRKHRQDRILRLPRFGHGTQHVIFDWRGCERRESRIDALRVGLENDPILRCGLRNRLLADVAEAVHAGRAIGFQGARADERAQLAGRLPPLQVHLEESILRVDESQRAGGVGARRGGDLRDPERVTIDDHRR